MSRTEFKIVKDGDRKEILISGSVTDVANLLHDAMTEDEDDIIAGVFKALTMSTVEDNCKEVKNE